MKRIAIVMMVILAAVTLSALGPVKSQVKLRRMDLSVNGSATRATRSSSRKLLIY